MLAFLLRTRTARVRYFLITYVQFAECGVLSRLAFLFVYEICRESSERICAKFTEKRVWSHARTEFESQGQRSKIKVTRDKNGIFASFGGLRVVYV